MRVAQMPWVLAGSVLFQACSSPATGVSAADAGATAAQEAAGSSAAGSSAAGSSAAGSSAAGDRLPMVGGCAVFPRDNPWNTDISALPVHADSDAIIDSIGRDQTLHPDFGTEWEGAPIGIPYRVVGAEANPVPIRFTAYGDESDPGPMPIPLAAAIEGGPNGDGDRHTLVIDETTCTLYELYRAFPNDAGGWDADSAAAFDLTANDFHPAGCTSADAAGLPIFPGLARYDEIVLQGEVLHALRFTVQRSRRAYVYPASHYASADDDPALPAMGMRFRMKAGYDCSEYSAEVQVLCRAMKRFGLILADNGSNWYISGAPDPRFDDDNLRDAKRIVGDAFEAVETGDELVLDAPDCAL